MPAAVRAVHKLSLAAALLAACEAQRSPPEDGLTVFEREVVPILDTRCGACHGLLASEFVEHAAHADNDHLLRWVVDEGGRIIDPPHTHRLLASEHWIDLGAPPLASPLLRATLPSALSGRVHPEIYDRTAHQDLVALARWVRTEQRRSPPSAAPPPSAAERFFAESVVPVLERKTCFGVNCHGPLAFNDLKLDPGLPALGAARFTRRMHAANRRAMLGAKTRLVHLSGDVTQSKQLLKNMPVSQGGIVHKGGNNFFEGGDPDHAVMVRWLELEAVEARARTGAELGATDGLLYVRRPAATPERFFEDLAFLGGADLFWRRGGQEVNLTASLHDGVAADVRAPDVSYDGERVVFAMRTPGTPFDLWEIELKSRRARQLTFSTDADVHYLDPLFVPPIDGSGSDDLSADAIVFVSNRRKRRCASSPNGALSQSTGGTRSHIDDPARTERPGALVGRTLTFVRGTHAGLDRRVVANGRGRIELDRPLPSPVDATSHYVIDVPQRVGACFDAFRMPRAPIGQARAVFQANVRQLTFSPEQIRRPSLRSSGEIVFTAVRQGWQSGRPFFNGALYRIHADGSDFHPHNGNRSGVPIHADDRELPNGLEIRIGRSADSYWGGALILSDHQFGPNVEPHNPTDDLIQPYAAGLPDTALHKFVPAWLSLDPEVTTTGVSAGGAYRDPYPMPDGSIVVSFAPGPIDLSDPGAAPRFELLRVSADPSFQREDGTFNRIRRETLVRGPGSVLWPRPVAPRLKERAKILAKSATQLAGPPTARSGTEAYPPGSPASLIVFDLPLLDAFFEQTAPVGRRVPDPQVTHLRIVGLEAAKTVIAEIPIEADGSVYAALPPNTPFDLQSVDDRGLALRSPNRWLYAVPGEKHTLSIPRVLFDQTCGGCHGALSGRPQDVLRRPDVVTSASRRLATWDAIAAMPKFPANWTASGLQAPIVAGFDRALRPIIAARCVPCHSAARRDGGLVLEGKEAFNALRQHIATRASLARESPLIERLLGEELDAPRPLKSSKPHPAETPLSDDELRAFIRWADLGGPA